MKYYSEISNIVESAFIGNKKALISYTELLIQKLKEEGEVIAVKGLESKIQKSKSNTIVAQSAFARPVPVEKDNRFSLADKTMPTLEEGRVFLSESQNNELEDFIQYILKKEQLKDIGIPSNPSLLLYGKPGTGKSQLANSLAAKLKLPLVTARADALISSYLGSTSKNIRSLLEYAQAEPCVLFLDEFDAIAKARDDKNEIGELKRVVVSLLQNIDNLGDTILVAATNHQHLLDPAVWRRFHYKMELKEPDENVRFMMIENLLRKFNVDKDTVSQLSKLSFNLTGAEIEMNINDYLRFIIVNNVQFDVNQLTQRFLKEIFPEIIFDSDNRKESMQMLQKYDNALFSYRQLGLIFGISTSYVGKILKGKS